MNSALTGRVCQRKLLYLSGAELLQCVNLQISSAFRKRTGCLSWSLHLGCTERHNCLYLCISWYKILPKGRCSYFFPADFYLVLLDGKRNRWAQLAYAEVTSMCPDKAWLRSSKWRSDGFWKKTFVLGFVLFLVVRKQNFCYFLSRVNPKLLETNKKPLSLWIEGRFMESWCSGHYIGDDYRC